MKLEVIFDDLEKTLFKSDNRAIFITSVFLDELQETVITFEDLGRTES